MEFLDKIPSCQVADVRGEYDASRMMDDLIEKKSFIVIDGVTGTGKSTLSQKIKKKYGKKVEILDIDLLCIQWMEQKKKSMSQIEFMRFLFNFEQESDRYLEQNLEKLVLRVSHNGRKSVVMVGSYLWVIARAVITYFLGRHFQNWGCITLQEEMSTIIARLRQRDENILMERVVSEYQIISQILMEDVNFLGIGMKFSVLANSQTDWGL